MRDTVKILIILSAHSVSNARNCCECLSLCPDFWRSWRWAARYLSSTTFLLRGCQKIFEDMGSQLNCAFRSVGATVDISYAAKAGIMAGILYL
jgi:hypothetical protein